MDDNQITAFHPGAMNHSQENNISDVQSCRLGIVSPDGRDGMLKHAQQFADKNIPFIFDPGQGMPMFNGEELAQFIEQATWVTVNDYEWQMMKEKTGLSEKEITKEVKALIVTCGGDGSKIYTKENVLFLNEYRQAFRNGFLTFDTSYTEGYNNTSTTKTSGSRNHIFANLDLNFSQNESYENNLLVKVQRTSNDTYLRIHDINTSLVDAENTTLENEFKYSFNKSNN